VANTASGESEEAACATPPTAASITVTIVRAIVLRIEIIKPSWTFPFGQSYPIKLNYERLLLPEALDRVNSAKRVTDYDHVTDMLTF
jgi:hypothetical protein